MQFMCLVTCTTIAASIIKNSLSLHAARNDVICRQRCLILRPIKSLQNQGPMRDSSHANAPSLVNSATSRSSLQLHRFMRTSGTLAVGTCGLSSRPKAVLHEVEHEAHFQSQVHAQSAVACQARVFPGNLCSKLTLASQTKAVLVCCQGRLPKA